MSGSSWPTVKSFKAVTEDGMVRLTRPLRFSEGDTVVSAKSAEMPNGYRYQSFDSLYPHPFMMNDVKTIKTALEYLNKDGQ